MEIFRERSNKLTVNEEVACYGTSRNIHSSRQQRDEKKKSGTDYRSAHVDIFPVIP